jgi:2-oxoisovalerate dehydrogenase E1 component
MGLFQSKTIPTILEITKKRLYFPSLSIVMIISRALSFLLVTKNQAAFIPLSLTATKCSIGYSLSVSKAFFKLKLRPCPSNGPDAAKMLRTCIKLAAEEGRVVVFLEPIALYMIKDLHSQGDNQWLFSYPPPQECIPYGEVGVYGEGTIAVLTYANGYYLSRQAAKILEVNHQISIKIIDIRWLSPLPMPAIIKATKHIEKILVVDEGRQSGSLSQGLMTLLMEQCPKPIILKRLTGKDCFIPLGSAWQHVLPSKETIIAAVIALHAEKREIING